MKLTCDACPCERTSHIWSRRCTLESRPSTPGLYSHRRLHHFPNSSSPGKNRDGQSRGTARRELAAGAPRRLNAQNTSLRRDRFTRCIAGRTSRIFVARSRRWRDETTTCSRSPRARTPLRVPGIKLFQRPLPSGTRDSDDHADDPASGGSMPPKLPGTRVRTVREGPVRVPGTYRTAPQVGRQAQNFWQSPQVLSFYYKFFAHPARELRGRRVLFTPTFHAEVA